MTVLKLLSFYSSTIQWICYISVYSIGYVHFQIVENPCIVCSELVSILLLRIYFVTIDS